MLNEIPAAEFFQKDRLKTALEDAVSPTKTRWNWIRVWLPAVATCAVASVVFIVSQDRKTQPNVVSSGVTKDKLRLKGQLGHLAVIRNRKGVQSRHTGSLTVQPGDALRVELIVTKAQGITVGLLDHSGHWMVLAPAREYEPGSYYVHPDAIVVEPGQTRGRIVAGPPRAVRAALDKGVFDAVWTVSIEGNSAP